MATHKPIAVLLVYPTDLAASPQRPTPEIFRDLYLNDPLSLHAFWRQVPDGAIDLWGAQVFGWRSHGLTRMQFQAQSRGEKIRRVVMSANHVTSLSTRFGRSGPGLNTVMRDMAGWLQPFRVMDAHALQLGKAVIYDAHEPDPSRPHVMRLDEYYFEFTMNSGWSGSRTDKRAADTSTQLQGNAMGKFRWQGLFGHVAASFMKSRQSVAANRRCTALCRLRTEPTASSQIRCQDWTDWRLRKRSSLAS